MVSQGVTEYRALVCSAGTAPARGIAQCFHWLIEEPAHVVTTDLLADVGGAALSDKHYTVPPYEDEGFFPALEEIVENEGIQVIFPTHLNELIFLSQSTARLPAWYRERVIINPPDVVLIANNKIETNAKWREAGGHVPKTFASLKELRDKDIQVVVKPAAGASRGYEQVHKMDSRKALECLTEPLESTMIQELIQGTELERVVELFTGIRFGNIQIMRDGEGEDYFIEINPKLPGTLIHSAVAGLNMPVILANELLGYPVDRVIVKPGVRLKREESGERFQIDDGGWWLLDGEMKK
jgi:glutathione synthase/RimK-type ligase-like ATP-grasp enzyme